MLSSRTRPVVSSSAPASWICLSCRAKTQHQRRFRHNEDKDKRGTARDGDSNDKRAVHSKSTGPRYLRTSTRDSDGRSSVVCSGASQRTGPAHLRNQSYTYEVNVGPIRQTTSHTTYEQLSESRRHAECENGDSILFSFPQKDDKGTSTVGSDMLWERPLAKDHAKAHIQQSGEQPWLQGVEPLSRRDEARLLHAHRAPASVCRQSLHGFWRQPNGQTLRMYSTNIAAETSKGSDIPSFAMNADPHHIEAQSDIGIIKPTGVRDQLRKWQELNGDRPLAEDFSPNQNAVDAELVNTLSRLPPEKAPPNTTSESDEHEAVAYFTDAGSDVPATHNLAMGDLVELEPFSNDRASTVAVFVRRLGVGHKLGGDLSQFLTDDGHWLHSRDRRIMFSVPRFLSKEMIERVVPYLPTDMDVEDLDALMEDAKMTDLSVPRDLSAPIIRELQNFTTEAKEIFRRHATRLDDAHQILAHGTDLRYGSLVTASCTLLRTTPNKLTQPAIFAVRQALMHAAFAFNIDRRSHRKTGYLQIRSKEQVKMVHDVRKWLREWQDDRSLSATMEESKLKQHTPSKGAQHVYSFLQKARRFILESRKTRQPTVCGSVGPSSKKLTATITDDCVQIETTKEFGYQETQIVKFMEVWAVTNQLRGHPRLESLPPLLLQATGLYDPSWQLTQRVGHQFLQELGAILPYENRVRFDEHLLLPSSQHSKPLQSLMASLISMQSQPDFTDSMAGLRKDWKDTPVYCIDDASAQEIDDGVSVQKADKDKEGNDTHWVHIHVANPTAFFSRDHPLAKMSRHMGESIYMPERKFMMLPRWTTHKHFSLAKDRPCLTFSARLDHKGETLEHKIEPGVIRNVISLTVDEVDAVLGGNVATSAAKEICMIVGGNPPPHKARTSFMPSLTDEQKQHLHTLQHLAKQRLAIRRRQGALFYESQEIDVSVWQNLKSDGLAWDHPYRRGRRTVYGDPGIRVRSKPFTTSTIAMDFAAEYTVRECMLLAGEIAANWCAERQTPGIFRGSVARADEDNDSVRFFQEKLEPLWRSGQYPMGEYPMHLGSQYLRTFGETHFRVRPFKHRALGMDAYGKVTSPLRRYGDMIIHWQIEAALREEARLGQSLVTSDPTAPRDFLPFSASVLETVNIGLQPREMLISRAKRMAKLHWAMLLAMRAHHFDETTLPLEKPGHIVAYVTATNMFLASNWFLAPAMSTEMNLPIRIERMLDGVKQGPFRQGDLWEVRIKRVDVWLRCIVTEPVRLLERVD